MSLRDIFSREAEPLYLIDGSSFLYRAFYAFPDLARSDGFPTNALYIMLRILLRLQNRENPSLAVFLLDGREPTFRNQIYSEYKANRLLMPEALSQQIPPILEGVQYLGIVPYTAEEAETDDYIASLAERFKAERPVVIVGSDKDLLQCLDEEVVLWDPGTREEKITTLQDFRSEYGLEPGLWPDLQALTGDKSDNIPGVPGIGPKTAVKLLHRFGSLQGILENLQELEPKLREKIRTNLENLELSRSLTGLKTDLFLRHSADDIRGSYADTLALRNLFREYELKSLLSELNIPAEDTSSVEPREAEHNERPRASLPQSLQGKALGLSFPDGDRGCLLGEEESEYSLQGDASSIVNQLKPAEKIYLPCYKTLLESDPAWFQLPPQQIFDISLASYLLDPDEKSSNWNRILDTFLPHLDVHRDNQGLAALKLGRLLEERLQQAELLQLKDNLEKPLSPVLVRMQERGIKIDPEAFSSFFQEVDQELQGLAESIYSLAGQEFNLRSSQQVARILFQELGLKPGRKTPSGTPSTASEVLEGMQSQHPIIAEILRYRSLEKLRSTYLEPLPRLADENHRIHSHFNQMSTATGRLSSSNPNLQNIPIKGEFGPRMRSCFVPEAGNLLVAADYSQIELRLLAHFSLEPNLLDAFTRMEDIHARTAGLILDKPVAEVTSDERRQAKTINFGLIYGMGPQKLARETGIKVQEAKEFIGIYFSKLQQVSLLFEKIVGGAQQQGYVTTLFGRRRLLPDINSRNENQAQQARRLAINTVIQGSAADVIKTAMLRVEEDEELRQTGAKLILQVHDELLAEVPGGNAEKAGKRMAEIMSSVVDLQVPLTAEWGLGENWAQAH